MTVTPLRIGSVPIGKMIRQALGWMIIFGLGGILAGMIGAWGAHTVKCSSPSNPDIGTLLGAIEGGVAGAVAGGLYGIIRIVSAGFMRRKNR